jgi:hypothetical protein
MSIYTMVNIVEDGQEVVVGLGEFVGTLLVNCFELIVECRCKYKLGPSLGGGDDLLTDTNSIKSRASEPGRDIDDSG